MRFVIIRFQGAGQERLGIYIKSVVKGGAADAVSSTTSDYSKIDLSVDRVCVLKIIVLIPCLYRDFFPGRATSSWRPVDKSRRSKSRRDYSRKVSVSTSFSFNRTDSCLVCCVII